MPKARTSTSAGCFTIISDRALHYAISERPRRTASLARWSLRTIASARARLVTCAIGQRWRKRIGSPQIRKQRQSEGNREALSSINGLPPRQLRVPTRRVTHSRRKRSAMPHCDRSIFPFARTEPSCHEPCNTPGRTAGPPPHSPRSLFLPTALGRWFASAETMMRRSVVTIRSSVLINVSRETAHETQPFISDVSSF